MFRYYFVTLCFILFSFFFKMNSNANQLHPDSLIVNRHLDQLFQDVLNRNPEFAASIGDKRNYHAWTDRSYAYRKATFEMMLAGVQTIKANFNIERLDPVTKLSVQLFEQEAMNMQISYQWRLHDFFINQLNGDHVDIPNFLINVHRIDNEKDARDYVSRLEGIEHLFDQDIYNLKQQKNANIAPPLFTYSYVIEDIQKMIEGLELTNEKNILLTDFITKTNALQLDKTVQNELQSKALYVLSISVKGAYKKLLDAIIDWKSIAHHNYGAWSLPQGEAYYQHQLKTHTTTNLTPDEIYTIGLQEVNRLHEEIKKNIPAFKKAPKTLKAFFNYLKTDKQFSYPNTQAGRDILLNNSNAFIKNINTLVPTYFNILPKAPCVVMPVEKFREASAAGAFYEQPSEDGSRPGRFYVNLGNMEAEKTYQLEALVYHEAIPGHHMQIAIAQELTGIPKFRRYNYNNAYVEGWALYAELLGKDMGLYKNSENEVGRLSMELFRAARLVVDVGIHQKKWTVEQATQYMNDNTLNSFTDCKREVERYFLWPGQATSYKIGMMHILSLRKKAQAALGSKFDIKVFHDILLKNGSVPMHILTELIDTWIARANSK